MATGAVIALCWCLIASLGALSAWAFLQGMRGGL